jgi:hypothetical protein
LLLCVLLLLLFVLLLVQFTPLRTLLHRFYLPPIVQRNGWRAAIIRRILIGLTILVLGHLLMR